MSGIFTILNCRGSLGGFGQVLRCFSSELIFVSLNVLLSPDYPPRFTYCPSNMETITDEADGKKRVYFQQPTATDERPGLTVRYWKLDPEPTVVWFEIEKIAKEEF